MERCYNCESRHKSNRYKFRDKNKKYFHCNNFKHVTKNYPDKNDSNSIQVMSNILVKLIDISRMFKQ